jgi:hypothetical protein
LRRVEGRVMDANGWILETMLLPDAVVHRGGARVLYSAGAGSLGR